MHQFHKFVLSWNSTCFGEFVCPSSGVYSLYAQQWFMSYRFRAVPGWNCSSILVLLESFLQTCMTLPLLSVQWINSWWWTDELSETCRASWQTKCLKLVRLVGFITKKNYNVDIFLHSLLSILALLNSTSAKQFSLSPESSILPFYHHSPGRYLQPTSL